MNAENCFVVTPWHKPEVKDEFLRAWQVKEDDPRLILVDDSTLHEGCARAKNRGIDEALRRDAEMVVILDSDCYPTSGDNLGSFIMRHWEQLNTPKQIPRYRAVTTPESRGTPYDELTMGMPVAASMGFWTNIPDYDALTEVARKRFRCEIPSYPTFKHAPIFGYYFPLCGMNLAYRPGIWSQWAQFLDVPRFDDIFMGYIWQKEAYHRGFCFSLDGPIVRHSRQSDPWANLREEAPNLELNETLWQLIDGFESRSPTLLRAQVMEQVERAASTSAA